MSVRRATRRRSLMLVLTLGALAGGSIAPASAPDAVIEHPLNGNGRPVAVLGAMSSASWPYAAT